MVLFLPLCLFARPQEQDSTFAHVKGRVVMLTGYDSSKMPAGMGINVRIISGKDTLGTSTDNLGFFKFDAVRVGKVKIIASHVNTYPGLLETEVFPGENVFEVPVEHKLSEWLQAAKVTARNDAMTHRGDTVVFHAGAVNTMEGDYLIDILNQMPGVELKDGKVYVEGKEVKRTYINGKLIFGDSPTSALNHLLASDVSTVEAYDENSIEDRRKGIKVGQKEKVLNVKTKKPVYSAWDAHAIASVGADGKADDKGKIQPRYGAGATANFFSEDFLTWLNVGANNIERNSNQINAILSVSPLRKYSETLLGDVGIEKHWNDRLLGSNIRTRYNARRVYTRDRNYSITRYFDMPGSPARENLDSLASSDVARKHDLYVMGSYVQEKIGVLNGSAGLHYTSKDASTTQRAENLLQDGTLFRQMESGRDSTRDWSTDATLQWSKTVGGKWTLGANLRGNGGQSSGLTSVADTLETSTNKRHIRWTGAGSHVGFESGLSAQRIILNTDVHSLQALLGVGVSGVSDRHSRDAYSLWPRPGGPLDGGSYDQSYRRFSYEFSTLISYSRSSFKTSLMAFMSLDRLSPQGSPSRKYFNVAGNMTVSYKTWLFTINAVPHIPDASQIEDRIDDRNPTSLIAGNPLLRPSTDFSAKLSYLNSTLIRSATFQASIDGAINTSPIVHDARYYSKAAVYHNGYSIPAGTMLSTWANAPTSWDIAVYGGYTQRIQPWKLTLFLQPSFHFGLTHTMVDGIAVPGYQTDISANGNRISWAPTKWFRLGVIESIGFTGMRGDALQRSNTLTNNLTVSPRVDFLKRWSASASYNFHYTKTSGVTDYSSSSHVLNASVGVKLLNGRLGISLSGTDLLGVNDSYTSRATSSYIKETWKPSYGRYFMLHLSWSFNKTSPVKYSGSLFDGHDTMVTKIPKK